MEAKDWISLECGLAKQVGCSERQGGYVQGAVNSTKVNIIFHFYLCEEYVLLNVINIEFQR